MSGRCGPCWPPACRPARRPSTPSPPACSVTRRPSRRSPEPAGLPCAREPCRAARRYLDAAAGLAGDNAPVAVQTDLAHAPLGRGPAAPAAALLDRILTQPGLPAPARLSAQLLLGQAAFHGGAVQRAGELFDAVVAASGHSDPGLALDAQLDHTLQSWTRLGP